MTLVCLLVAGVSGGGRAEDWQAVGPRKLLDDPAVAVALSELQARLRGSGMSLARVLERDSAAPAVLLEVREDLPVDIPPGLNEKEKRAIAESAYEIEPSGGAVPSVCLRARSPLGLAYAVFDAAGEVRVRRELRAVRRRARPRLPYRFAAVSAPVPVTPEAPDVAPGSVRGAVKAFEGLIHAALRRRYNWLIIGGAEDYVPWDDPRHAARSEAYRRYLEGFIAAAHAHHLRLLLMGDEYTYLPQLVDPPGSRPSVKDERLWSALQSKYRRLLAACPALDGVGTRIGEQVPRFDFRTLDLIHSPEAEPDPRLEERYRRFLKAMHEVVAGEAGKVFLHRTWVTNVHEQHSVPEVLRSILEGVPQEGLLVSIKLTAGDQWYHVEPFNETFGVTRHATIAEGELYSGYHGGGSFLVYPARYFQAALEWAVERGARGILNGLGRDDLTGDAILHAFSRLAWEPRADLDDLTVEWAAATFGKDVAPEVAELFLLAPTAIRDGLYLRQPGLRNWNPLRHLRTTHFVLRGNPLWDRGREQDRFLKEIYLEVKPWLPQTREELARGVSLWHHMASRYERLRPRIGDPGLAARLEGLLRHGLALLELNRGYVEGFLSYFTYRERPGPETRGALAAGLESLRGAAQRYREEFDHFQLLGIDAFLELAARAHQDLEEAERILEEAPAAEEVERMFAAARRRSAELLGTRPDARLVATWEGTVDGRDLVRIQGGGFEVEHLAADPIHSARLSLHREIPRDRSCEVLVKPLEVRGTAYLREPPAAENGYTVTVYLEDPEPGASVVRFELWVVCGEG